MKGLIILGLSILLQFVKDWNTCRLGPCEIPGPISDQFIVRQHMTL